eukprot:scaffold54092_cov57-Phaeocystis_antarctica.AAC.1
MRRRGGRGGKSCSRSSSSSRSNAQHRAPLRPLSPPPCPSLLSPSDGAPRRVPEATARRATRSLARTIGARARATRARTAPTGRPR